MLYACICGQQFKVYKYLTIFYKSIRLISEQKIHLNR